MNSPSNDFSTTSPLALEHDLLRTFVAIVETGSFKAAADMVFRTPSAVSMQVKKLEDIVGRTLLRRDARAVSLTPDGEMLLSYARRILQLSDEAIRHFRKPLVEGTVRLGAHDDDGSRFLPSILKRFAITHPGVMVDVIFESSVSLTKKVKKGEIDLAIIAFFQEERPDPDVEIILEEQLVWAGVRGGCAHKCDPLPVSMWEEGCPWRADATAALASAGRKYRLAYMSAHTAGQRAAVLADLAVAPFPASLVEPPMVELTPQDGLPKLGTYRDGLIVRPDPGDAVLAVADHVKSAFKDMQINRVPRQADHVPV
ncbi:MAG: LysR family transcriptional regulator [Pseudomonadota bacterium]